MKHFIVLLIAISMNAFVYAEITQTQMRDVSKKIIEETLQSSKLNGEYKQTLRIHLEKIMYNEKITDLFIKIINDNSVSNMADAEKMGFNIISGLREKSLLTLSNDDLYILLKLNIAVMEKMTDFECAQYIKKKRTDEDNLGRGLYEITGNLNINLFKDFIGYYDKSFDNLLANKSQSIKLNESEMIKIKNEFQSLMKDLVLKNKFVSDFLSSGKNFTESTNSDVCRIGKELLSIVVSGDAETAKKRASAYVNGQLY